MTAARQRKDEHPWGLRPQHLAPHVHMGSFILPLSSIVPVVSIVVGGETGRTRGRVGEGRHALFFLPAVDMIAVMCGRYLVTTSPELIAEVFRLGETPAVHPTWNAAPTQLLPVVRAGDRGNRLDHLRWGLVPSWAKELAVGNRMINARSETAADKPSFRSAFRRRRCLVVADGFYEWKRDGERKRPFCIRLEGHRPFGMAGLWESWQSPEDELVETYTILTTTPNGLVQELHDRMPVIIAEHDHDRWLAPDLQDPGQVDCLLAPYPAGSMTAFEVSTHVNSTRNNDPGCAVPVHAAGEGPP